VFLLPEVFEYSEYPPVAVLVNPPSFNASAFIPIAVLLFAPLSFAPAPEPRKTLLPSVIASLRSLI